MKVSGELNLFFLDTKREGVAWLNEINHTVENTELEVKGI